MKPNQLAKFAAVVLALVGVATLLAAGVVATRSFEAHGLPRSRLYDCGSVVFAKDPQTLVAKLHTVPRNLVLAHQHCETLRDSRTHKALTFMVAGVLPLLLVLALPAISRASRRASRRRARA